MRISIVVTALLVCAVGTGTKAAAAEEKTPNLPDRNATVSIAAQEWRYKPGPRKIGVRIHYPQGKLQAVNSHTGLMLTLHNWGGTFCVGTANPDVLANQLNVVAICINYLQSGKQASILDPEPYDFGYLQSLDALRALYFVFHGLEEKGIPFHHGRIFATGGSGGGNVTLMANKLAPRTFACVIDLSGMPKLSDDIAFHLPGGSGLDARYSRDPENKNFLSKDEQQIRFNGHPGHLATMKKLGNTCKIVVVHGSSDTTCPFDDAREMVANFEKAHLDIDHHFLTKDDLDGKVFTNTGHGLGNRTLIVFKVAEKYLKPGSPETRIRKSPTDFERRDKKVRYQTPNGEFVISYKNGYPVGKFQRD